MKIVLAGKNDRVGWKARRSLAPLGKVTVCGSPEADFNYDVSLCPYRPAFDYYQAENAGGPYHLAARGETGWHESLHLVVKEAAGNGVPLRPDPKKGIIISISGLPLPAKRPFKSRLDSSRICSKFGFKPPSCNDEVNRLIATLIEKRTI